MAAASLMDKLACVASRLLPTSPLVTVYCTCLSLTLKDNRSPTTKLPLKVKILPLALPDTTKRVSLPVSKLTGVAGLIGETVTLELDGMATLEALNVAADCLSLTN